MLTCSQKCTFKDRGNRILSRLMTSTAVDHIQTVCPNGPQWAIAIAMHCPTPCLVAKKCDLSGLQDTVGSTAISRGQSCLWSVEARRECRTQRSELKAAEQACLTRMQLPL